jgi:hypothetical protein
MKPKIISYQGECHNLNCRKKISSLEKEKKELKERIKFLIKGDNELLADVEYDAAQAERDRIIQKFEEEFANDPTGFAPIDMEDWQAFKKSISKEGE